MVRIPRWRCTGCAHLRAAVASLGWDLGAKADYKVVPECHKKNTCSDGEEPVGRA